MPHNSELGLNGSEPNRHVEQDRSRIGFVNCSENKVDSMSKLAVLVQRPTTSMNRLPFWDSLTGPVFAQEERT
jgi:hypothetical protein